MSAGVERKRKPPRSRLLASSSSDAAGGPVRHHRAVRGVRLTPRAIRFYEDKGLLTPRRVNGARVYTQRDRARLKLILRAKAIGSSLDEIKQYLDLYGNHGEGRSKQLQYTLERTDAAIAELEQKRAHIEATLAELRVINDTVRRQLAATPAK
jgi:DNA-binding transcriptional MerR regulator